MIVLGEEQGLEQKRCECSAGGCVCFLASFFTSLWLWTWSIHVQTIQLCRLCHAVLPDLHTCTPRILDWLFLAWISE